MTRYNCFEAVRELHWRRSQEQVKGCIVLQTIDLTPDEGLAKLWGMETAKTTEFM